MAETIRTGKNKKGGDYSFRLVIAEATITKDGQVQALDTQSLVDALADTMEEAIATPKKQKGKRNG